MFCAMTLTPWNGDPEYFWVMALLYAGIFVIVLLPYYILNSLALFRISSRRGILHAWLSWIPFGSSWILGCISDQYQQIVHGKTKKRRRILLISGIMNVVLYVLTLVMMFAWFLSLEDTAYETESLLEQLNGPALACLVTMVMSLAVAIVGAVFNWLATYDLFRSCEPKNAVVYVAVSLAIKFLMPSFEIIKQILVLMVSKKDLGMQPSAPPMPVEVYTEQNEE